MNANDCEDQQQSNEQYIPADSADITAILKFL